MIIIGLYQKIITPTNNIKLIYGNTSLSTDDDEDIELNDIHSNNHN